MIVEIETGLLRGALEKMAGELPDLIAGALESALAAPVAAPELPLEDPTPAGEYLVPERIHEQITTPPPRGEALAAGNTPAEHAERPEIACVACGEVQGAHEFDWWRTEAGDHLCPACYAAHGTDPKVTRAGIGRAIGERRLYRTRYQFVEWHPDRAPEHRWRAKDPRPHTGSARPELGCYATEAEAVLAVIGALVDYADPHYSGATAATSERAALRLLSEWIRASRRKAARVTAEPERSAYACEVTA